MLPCGAAPRSTLPRRRGKCQGCNERLRALPARRPGAARRTRSYPPAPMRAHLSAGLRLRSASHHHRPLARTIGGPRPRRGGQTTVTLYQAAYEMSLLDEPDRRGPWVVGLAGPLLPQRPLRFSSGRRASHSPRRARHPHWTTRSRPAAAQPRLPSAEKQKPVAAPALEAVTSHVGERRQHHLAFRMR